MNPRVNIVIISNVMINNNNTVLINTRIIQGVPKLTLDISKTDSLANLKTIFPQRKCRGTNSFRVIND